MERLGADVVDRPVLGVDLEPPGRSVGPPKSSWFHQLPKRPIPARRGALAPRSRRASRRMRRNASRRSRPRGSRDRCRPKRRGRPSRSRTVPPLVGQLVPARDHVVQARADDAGSHTPHRDAEDEIPVSAAPGPADPRDRDRGRDRDEQRQPVEVDRERPELDRARLGRRNRESGSTGGHSAHTGGRHVRERAYNRI